MKDKVFSVLCVLLILSLLAVPVFAENTENTVNDVQSVVDGILAGKLSEAGAGTVQEWIDGELTGNAGTTSEWYVFALSQSGDYDFSAYEKALTAYVEANTIRSASSRLKYALVLASVGSESGYIEKALADSIGQQGIMSWIYGLHLLNNGVSCTDYTTADVLDILAELQHEDGGWSLSGDIGDTDVTAMTMQALAPHYETSDAVKTAADKGLAFLSSKQQEDGGYASYGIANPESTAQVLVTLSSLGIDCAKDERFLKNGNTVIDGMMNFRLDDGTFCHKHGEGSNHTATVQAFYSMIAYLRMTEGKSPLYILDDEPAVTEEEMQEITDAPAETEMPEEETAEEIPAEVSAPEETDSVEPSEETERKTEETLPEETQPIPEPVAELPEITEKTIGYKPVVSLILVGLGGMVCLIFFIIGKRHIKNFIAIAVLTGLGVMIVLMTDFQSADHYYNGQNAVKENSVGTVTMTIRCDTIVGKSDSEYIPADGVILETTEFAIEEGDSAYDILTEAAKAYHIQVENAGQWDMVYIAGINYLYEFDFGDLSGWIYHVNGLAPSVGCGEYILQDGDRIEWLYTCDLGNDLRNGN